MSEIYIKKEVNINKIKKLEIKDFQPYLINVEYEILSLRYNIMRYFKFLKKYKTLKDNLDNK